MRQFKNPNVERFIGHVISELLANGFYITLSNESKVDEVNGYFDARRESKDFGVALGNAFTTGLGIFAHEYGHFLQWKDKQSIWYSYPDNVKLFFDWLNIDDDKITDRIVHGTQMVELDCEKRVIKIIKEFNLPINIKKYCRASNAYIWSYQVIKRTRKWPKKPPYTDKKILQIMPNTHLKKKEYTTPPTEYINLVLDRCY